jgi:hypothetical protein
VPRTTRAPELSSFGERPGNLFPACSPYINRERCPIDRPGWSEVELTCAETPEAAAEFALNVLPRPQVRLVAAHLSGCDRGRREVEALTEIAVHLVDFVPGTEPPLGFDRSVLARVMPGPRRARMVVISVVAAVILCGLMVVSAVHVVGGSAHRATPAGVTAGFRAGGVPVGSFSARGRPMWVAVVVRGMSVSRPVSRQLVDRNGSVQTLGRFDLVGGTGSCAVPDPPGIGRDQEARLIDGSRQGIATATWS